MDEKLIYKCKICSTPLKKENEKCPLCGAQYLSSEDMSSHPLSFLSEAVKKEVKIPLDFWKNENLVFMSDTELYVNSKNLRNVKKAKSFEKLYKKLAKNYKKKAKTRLMDNRKYWYLLKFFYISSSYINLIVEDTENNVKSPLTAGIPKGIKLTCKCGKKLKDQYFMRGSFVLKNASSPFNKQHDFYLRISNQCTKCDKTMVVYRPKTGVYFSLLIFMSHIIPDQNLNFQKDIGMLIIWLNTLIEATNKNKFRIFKLYYEDIKKFWYMLNDHPNLPQKLKYDLKHLTLRVEIEAYERLQNMQKKDEMAFFQLVKELKKKPPIKKSLKEKLTTLNQFLGRQIYIALQNINSWLSGRKSYKGSKKQLDNFMRLNNECLTLYYTISLNLFCNTKPNNITIPLKKCIHYLEMISEPFLKKDLKVYKWLLYDLKQVLDEENIFDIESFDGTVTQFLNSKEDVITAKNIYIFQVGSIIASILEVINYEQIAYNGKGLDILENIYFSLGRWIFDNKKLNIKDKIDKLKISLSNKQNHKFKGIDKLILGFINTYEQEIGINGRLLES